MRLFPVLVLALLPLGCNDSSDARALETRAVVIGIDSADWTMIDALIAEGDMPVFASLKQRGTSGDIATLTDIPLSPVIWTSVATGKSAAKHGITWFMVDQPDGSRVPVRSTNRKTEAIWNIVDRVGLSSATVGWWATYPAEQLDHGTVVSDGVGVHGFGSTARHGSNETKVHPRQLFDRVDSLMPVEQQITHEFAGRFMNITAEEYDRLRFDPARMARPHPMSPIHLFQQYAVTAEGYTRIGEELLPEEFELAMLYFEQVDSFSHLFMKYDEPKLEWVDQASFERYKRFVREWYRYQDELLGRLLEKIDLEKTALFILSDHGFKIGDRRIKSDKTVDIKKAHLDHEKEGILLAVGPHIRRGGTIRNASVIDLTPTVLHYLGLAVGKDMDGKVLEQLFDDEFRAANPIQYIGSYETGERTGLAAGAVDARDAADIEAGLTALGYMDSGGGADGGVTTPSTDGESSPEIHNNLGRIHLSKGEVELAVAEFEKALALDSNNAEALLNIGAVHQAQGKAQLAQYFAERALAVDPNSVGALGQLAEAKRDQNLLDDAERLYREALSMTDSQPGLYLGLGDVQQRAGKYEEAETSFKEALALDPDSFPALYNLGVTYAQMDRAQDAIERYEAALEKSPEHPSAALAHNNLGALHRDAGDVDRALASFERAAELSPYHLEARFNAATIYIERGRLDDAIEFLEQAAELQPNHELIQARLGITYLRAGRAEDAHKSLLLVHRLYPSNWGAKLGLAALYQSAERAPEARELFDRAIELGGEEARAFARSFPALESFE